MERRKRMELEECCLKAEECKARMESRLQDIQRSLACHPVNKILFVSQFVSLYIIGMFFMVAKG